jgi:hypothetical protein
VDVPAYEAWLHRTFPTLITKLRDLHEEVSKKARQVQSVQALASLTGRSPKKLWREQKEYEADPEAFEKQFEDETETEDRRRRPEDEDFFGEQKSARDSWQDYRRSFESDDSERSRGEGTKEAKAIYRRLVQRLHPDRGGEFTPVRKRLWHEVQQAWALRDADWLSRIEVEWETANDVLTPKSAVSRIRRAIAELHAARRDLEKKLREYRSQWRFTLAKKKRDALHQKIQANFTHDIEFLERQLSYLNATIAAWESVRSPRQRYRESLW